MSRNIDIFIALETNKFIFYVYKNMSGDGNEIFQLISIHLKRITLKQ